MAKGNGRALPIDFPPISSVLKALERAPIVTMSLVATMAYFHLSGIYYPLDLSNPLSLLLFHFSHSSVDHLLQNVFSLLLFGWFMEREGRGKYLGILFASSMAGGISAYLLSGSSGAGMSAGIFGIMGYLMLRGSRHSIGTIPLPFLAFAYSAFNLAQSLHGREGISYLAHAAGFLAGMAFALPPEEWQRDIAVLATIMNIIASMREVLA